MNWQPSLPPPLRRKLDAFVALPDRFRLPLAVVAALLVHGLVLVLFWLAPYFVYILAFLQPLGCTVPGVAVAPTPTPPPLEIVIQPPEPEPEPEPVPEVKLTPVQEEQLQQLFQNLPEELRREYIDVEGLAKKKNLSKAALLESWQDSVAGSRKPGKGDNPLPSQDGREDLNFTNFKKQNSVVGDPKKDPGAEAVPKLPLPLTDPAPLYKPAPVAKPDLAQADPEKIPKTATLEKPTPVPTPPPPPPPLVAKETPPPDLKKVVEANADEIPMFVFAPRLPGMVPPDIKQRDEPRETNPSPTPTPTPPPSPTPVPKPTPVATPKPAPPPTPRPTANRIEAARITKLQRPTPVANPGYTPHMDMRKIDGGAAPAGENGVDAVATEKGRYIKALNQAVGSRWTYYVRDAKHGSMITQGTTTLKFALNAKGKIVRLQVTDNTSNTAHAALCERAFLESQSDIDPPPRTLLRNGMFEDVLTFHLY